METVEKYTLEIETLSEFTKIFSSFALHVSDQNSWLIPGASTRRKNGVMRVMCMSKWFACPAKDGLVSSLSSLVKQK